MRALSPQPRQDMTTPGAKQQAGASTPKNGEINHLFLPPLAASEGAGLSLVLSRAPQPGGRLSQADNNLPISLFGTYYLPQLCGTI